ncbi:hypothetical protein [Methylobacterium fujisawaense]
MKRYPAALSILATLYAGTAAAEIPSAGDRTTWLRISCSQYGSLVYSDEKAADDSSASSDWREKVSRSFPKAICVTARRVGGLDPKFKQFGTLPDVMPAPEPPPEPVAVLPPPPSPKATTASAVPVPLHAPGTPGARVDDASLNAALSAIGLRKQEPAGRQPNAPVPAASVAPAPARPPEPAAAPAAEAKAPADHSPAVETVAFLDGQDYATGGFIVSDEPARDRRDAGRRTVLAGMVFAEPGQASGYGNPGMITGGVMVAEAEPETRVSEVVAAAALPEPAVEAEHVSARSVVVQLASFAGWERGRMQGVWRQLSAKASALAGLEPRIVRIGGQKVYTALRVGPLDEDAAKGLARTLGDKGIESRMLPSPPSSMVAMVVPAER